jgi:hypothetical protein
MKGKTMKTMKHFCKYCKYCNEEHRGECPSPAELEREMAIIRRNKAVSDCYKKNFWGNPRTMPVISHGNYRNPGIEPTDRELMGVLFSEED